MGNASLCSCSNSSFISSNLQHSSLNPSNQHCNSSKSTDIINSPSQELSELESICSPCSAKLSIKDFTMEKELGRGAFGKVILVSKKSNPGKYYAMKILNKNDIFQLQLKENAVLERQILQNNSNPFIISLQYAFQTSTKIYLVIEYMSGGDLFNFMKQHGRLSEKQARFILCEVILALEYLHTQMNIVYRDLKPENILISNSGHIKITDFGLSAKAEKKINSMCGTPEYVAPEILLNKEQNKAVDLWSCGILLYEMLSGKPPFYSQNRNVNELQKKILENNVNYPSYFNYDEINLISNLLKNEPDDRLGMNGYSDLKKHKFFKDVIWSEIEYLDSPLKISSPKIQKKEIDIKETYDLNSLPNIEGLSYNPETVIKI